MYKVYKYTNIRNGKIYIGQTKNSLKERAQRDGLNYRECTRFYNAIQKYGWDSFRPEILADGLTMDEANELEEYYILLYDSVNPDVGYNLAAGGLNHAMSEESRALLSAKAKERYADKTRNPMYGKKHSEDSIARMSEMKRCSKNPMYGTKWNETQRQRCGVKGKKLNLSDEQREKYRQRGKMLGRSGTRRVRCVEDNIEFESMKEAALYYGVSKASICDQLKGRTHTCKEKHFEYVT